MNKKWSVLTYFTLSVIGLMLIYFIGSYFLLHTSSYSSAKAVDKYVKNNDYYISVEIEENQIIDIIIESKSTWDLIKVNANYQITYSWYGNEVPILQDINIVNLY
ncbi:hypothetical protein CAI16_01480 [Virgibacillus dokdonensis]|uniref:DUF3139 domain-containing protein n=1 Tax=Virgibacillus dokdonensis TaxID=302167 RepID=A0A3E0WWI3_9BACI|nr:MULTISPECIES: hypothetical protein [Virgibacillus]RFA37178.1 hypothetical protein CAI16_01480 [Virgibacillus dokdonensis]